MPTSSWRRSRRRSRRESSTSVRAPGIPRLGRRACAGLFLLALAARAAAILWFGASTTRFGDAEAYMRAATELVATGHYPKRTEPFYFRAPGYPYFLAAATLGHPRSVAAGKAINAVLGALAALLLAALSARIFGSRPVAFATGIAAALHPGLVMLSTDVQSEPLFVVLLLVSGYLLLAAADRPSS